MSKYKSYPNISYLLMAMEESWRGNGWYNESIGEPALKAPEIKKLEYKNKIKERLIYFLNHKKYTLNFYINKLNSMWTENTYSAIYNNSKNEKDILNNFNVLLSFYQKTSLVITCICTLIVLLQNKKNLSLDVIFLITIFIGGFAFHILWEAKSRYIIPYVIILIPIASININKIHIKKDKY